MEVRAVLARLGVHPNKSLGQNFLTDPERAREIVALLEATAGDCVVEVGPGLGALSDHLIGKVRRLMLIEKDPRLAAWLRERHAKEPSVEVIEADALAWDVRPVFAERPAKFIGNLPYSCGGEILRAFLTPPHPFERAVVMLQKEVAERLTASPRTKDYGALTLLTAAHWRVERKLTLGPEPFFPAPEIDSTVLRLDPWPNRHWPPFDHRLFRRLVRGGFAQRRKQLKNLLLQVGCAWESCRDALGLSPTARAEELTLAQWIALTREADDHPLKDNPQRGEEIFDVVDERDEVIGQASRRVVHAENLRHRAVHIFVFNSRGELFLQKRSTLKDAHPGVWDSSAAGHLDAGEDYDSAAVRELEEELGIRGVGPIRLAKIAASERTGWEHVWLYRATWDGDVRYPCSEIETGQYFPRGILERWTERRPEDFATGFLECLRACRDSC